MVSTGRPVVRLVGFAWVVCGAALFVAYPVARVSADSTLGFWVTVENFGPPLACLGAVVLVWGLATAATGQLRSLTPARAAVAPVLVPIPNAVAERAEPPPVLDWGVGGPWQPPATTAELAGRVFLANGEVFVAASAFVVFGVASARGDRWWQLATLGALSTYGFGWGLANTSFLHGLVLWPLIAAVPGTVPAAIGYLTAELPDRSDEADRDADSANAAPG